MRFSELQTMINARRKAQQLPTKEIPEEIKNLEQQIDKYQAQLDQATKDGRPVTEIVAIQNLLNPAKRRLQQEINRYQGRPQP